jgi:hypothetical protein
MTLSIANVAGTSPTFLCIIPPGECNVSVSGSAAFYVGFSDTVSSNTGFHISSTGALTFFTYPGSAGGQLWFSPISGTAGTVNVSAIISTNK